MTRELDLFDQDKEEGFVDGGTGRRGGGPMGVSLPFQRVVMARPLKTESLATPSSPEPPPAPEAAAALAVPKVVTTEAELLALLRARRDELQLTHMELDRLTGWADGYASKVLSPEPLKGFTEKSLSLVLDALALGIARIEFIVDPAQVERMKGRWTKRVRPQMRPRRTRSALLEAKLGSKVRPSTTQDDGSDEPKDARKFPDQA
jgi:hypothetical protein